MNAKTIIRQILCWPLFLGVLVILCVRAMWGDKLWWRDGVLFTRLRSTSWPMRSWYRGWGGTNMGGYAVMLAPNGDNETTIRHELHHTEQQEASALAGLMVGIIAASIAHTGWGVPIFFMCWISAGWFAYLGAMLAAWLRGENSYRGNHLEEGAYDATKASEK